MKKITNIITSPTKFTEDRDWISPISYKMRLLQNSDWILQVGSGVLKQHKWLKWRDDLRKCTRSSCTSPQELQSKLEQLDSEIPELVRYSSVDTTNIDHYRDNVIKLVKYYYSKRLDIDICSYLTNIHLMDERYKEAEKYQNTNNLQDCHFIKSYMDITGESVENVVEYFIKQKEMYYLLLLRSQQKLESKLKEIDDIDNIDKLKEIYEEYTIWISTLTLTPVQI
jgi:hypothetical protein